MRNEENINVTSYDTECLHKRIYIPQDFPLFLLNSVVIVFAIIVAIASLAMGDIEVWTGVVEIFVGCVIFAYNIVYFCSCGVPFLPAIVPLEKAREWDKEEEKA